MYIYYCTPSQPSYSFLMMCLLPSFYHCSVELSQGSWHKCLDSAPSMHAHSFLLPFTFTLYISIILIKWYTARIYSKNIHCVGTFKFKFAENNENNRLILYWELFLVTFFHDAPWGSLLPFLFPDPHVYQSLRVLFACWIVHLQNSTPVWWVMPD